MSSDYLEINFSDQRFPEINPEEIWEGKVLPFAKTELYLTNISNVKKLTSGDDVKRVYALSLELENLVCDFKPGDTIGILPLNNAAVVETLLRRLNVWHLADRACSLIVSRETKKRSAALPKHIPKTTCLKHIFTYYVDIRTPPKKIFLKNLIKYTTDPTEISRLENLTSPIGFGDYSEFISGPGRTLQGFLDSFPSCLPPIDRILEHMPALQPRVFSISSSPLWKYQLDITVSVVDFPGGGRGLCTGWLEDVAKSFEPNGDGAIIPFYFREPSHFSLIEDPNVPIIMVAAGAGIAPFRSFLQHRFFQVFEHRFAEAWLFYGCRYAERDLIYGDEMERYTKSGALTRLTVCGSREGKEKRYVQDEIEENGKDVVDWLLNKNAVLYVCGDPKTMMRDVRKGIVRCFVKYNRVNESEGETFVKMLEENGRYRCDRWL